MSADGPGPAGFPDRLRALADGGLPTRAVVVGAHAGHVLEGVRQAADLGWIDPVLLGPEEGLRQAADEIGWDIGGLDHVYAEGPAAIAETAVPHAADPSTGMVIKGLTHTSTLFRALLAREARLRAERHLVHVFHLSFPEGRRDLSISDGGLVVAPDESARRAILETLVELHHALGTERPRVAVLAATEKVYDHMPATTQAAALAQWAEDTGLEADVSGPLAFDLAVSEEAARIKGASGPVAGRADAIVVPNIETGNAIAKALIWYGGACAAGLVLGGRIPVTVPSRSDSAAARLASVAVARIFDRAQPGLEIPPKELRLKA